MLINQVLKVIEIQQVYLSFIDISLKGTNILEFTERMKLSCPNLVVPMFPIHYGFLYAQLVLRAGKSEYAAKYEAFEKIITAVHQLLDGKVYISDRKTVRMMSNAASNSCDGPGSTEKAAPNSI